jgi:glycosyltransferase involved in cell wall biosynthesis
MVVNKKLSVLQALPDLNSGGVEQGTLEINKYLASKGYRSIVVSNGGRMVKQVLKDKGEHYKLAIGKKNLLTIFTIFKLIKFIKKNKINIIHARSRLPAWVCYFALKLIKKNVRPVFITTFHGAYSVNIYSSIMAKGDKVIVVSEMIKKFVLKNFKVSEEKLFLNYRGVSDKEFYNHYKVSKKWIQKWHKDFPQTKGKILLTMPGRISRIKGQDHFILILKKIIHKHPNAHGIIIGEEKDKHKYMNELKSLIKELGLKENLTFVGHRKDIKKIMSISKIVFSLTKIPEAFGRVSLESLSLGIPVIAYAHGGVKEQLIKLQPEGLVGVKNFTQAANKAQKMLITPPKIKKNNFFTLEKMLQNTLSIYKKTIEEKEVKNS